jgi:putative ABC transport system permease protein
LWRDVALGARFLRRNPGFSAVALVTLALGIGVNTAVFGAFYGIVLKPLPFDRAARLVEIQTRNVPSSAEWRRFVSAAVIDDVGARSTSLQHVAYAMAMTATLGGGTAYEAVDGTLVSGSYFQAYDTAPALGRYLTPADVDPSSPKVVVISHECWQRTFGGDPAILGKTVDVAVERPFIILSQAVPPTPHTVVGVMPPRARFPVAGDVWLPFVEFGPASGHGAPPRHVGNVTALATMRDGWTLAQARDELRAVALGLAADHPATDGGIELTVVPLVDVIAGPYRIGLLLLLGAVGSVLLLACVNVSSLLMARSGARRRDVAVRQALGAPRRQILQQLLCESLLLACLGGAAGTAVASWSVGAIRVLAPAGTPRLGDLEMSAPTVLYAVGVSVLVALVIGVWPALRLSAPQERTSLTGTRAAAGAARASFALPIRVRSLLVGAQIALAVVLTAGAALAAQSLGRLLRVDLGFQPDRVVTMQVGLSSSACAPFEACVATINRIIDDARRVHGVEAASIAADRPFGVNRAVSVAADGQSDAPQFAAYRLVTAGYFDTLGIRTMAGRTFTVRDDGSSPRVAVVSRALSHRMFGGSALGRRVSLGPSGRSDVVLEIVGEVADVRDVDPAVPSAPTLYVPFAQARLMPRVSLLARTTSDDASVMADLRRVVGRDDPRAAITDARMLDRVVAETTANPSFQAGLLGAFAVIGTLLAVVGVYGLVSYTVASRMREFGVRLALGGTSRDITVLVLKEGVVSIACGLVVGGLASMAIGRGLRRFLFEAAPTDAVVVAGVALALSLAALAAYGAPARAVSKLDPAHILRDE